MNKKKFFFVILLLGILLILASCYIGIKSKKNDGKETLHNAIEKINYHIIKEYKKDSYVNSILIDDLDGDSKKEIIYKDSYVNILENDWTLRARCNAGSSGDGIEKLITADVNGDGRREIITAGSLWNEQTKWHGDYFLRVFDLNCNLLKEYNFLSQLSETQGLFFDDIDNNGVKELVIGLTGPIFIINGDEIKSYKEYNDYKDSIYAVGFQQDFKIADLDNDGKKELLVLGTSGLSVLDNNGKLIWKYIDQTGNSSKWFYSMGIEDIDRDGMEEVIISGGDFSYVFNFRGEIIKKLQVGGPINIIDMDNDSINELIIGTSVFNSDYNLKHKFLRGGNEIIADINNDNKLEFVVYSTDAITYVGPTDIFIFDQLGDLLWKYKYPTWISSVAVEDLNNDGYKEIFVSGHFDAPITVFGIQ